MERILVILFQFLGGCLTQFLFLFSMAQVMPCRLGKAKLVLLAALLETTVIWKAAFGVSRAQLPATVLAVILLTFIVGRYYEGGRLRKLLVTLGFLGVGSFGDSLAFSMVGFTAKIETWTLEQTFIYFGLAVPYAIFMNAAAVSVARSLSLRKFQGFYLVYMLFPLSHVLVFYFYMFSAHRAVWVAGTVCGIAADIALLLYTVRQEEKTRLEEQLRESRHMMELERAHYQAVETRREEMARIRHDFNNQLAVIGQLVRKGNDEDAQQMITQLAAEIGRTRENYYCGIPVVDAVLTEKGHVCEEAGIRLEPELALPEDLAVEPIHLCSIFSNLLDNAIRGAGESQVKEPVISLKSRNEGDYVFICVVNPSAPPRGIAEKPTADGHGYGTRILADLAQRYGGGYRGRYEDGKFTALVSLLRNP